MNRYKCIHCHFYQPPRENPWLEEIELQDSAYPFHDWNEKITDECYAPNTASRILDSEKKIVDIVNNYSKVSFNFGPTLLSWLERRHPEVYQSILEADRLSMNRFRGHGSAIAQVYNHMIMPLANRRDKRTQIIWGIKDFEYRFGRKPKGMWLSETAVDIETLDIMAESGIIFTILAPQQARRVRRMGEEKWDDVSGGKVDPKMPYQCNLPSGRLINIFFYDGPLSHDVAFGNLLKSGVEFANRLLGAYSALDEPQLVHVATDGESYGHHHRFGDMALAYALHYIESNNLAQLTNYSEYLTIREPRHEVDILENSSWSCIHGVERWANDCGCHTGLNPGWTQAWRAPLREALNWLRDRLITVFEKEIESFIQDPWDARNEYIKIILDRSLQNIDTFFSKHALRKLSSEERINILKLLEMQRNAMLMFTSCGWFFDEISGIETIQIMQYAARALQLAKETSGADLEPDFLEIIKGAPSNVAEYKDGAHIWDLFVKSSAVDLNRVAAHYAISSIFEEYPKSGKETTKIFCYTACSEVYDFNEVGEQTLAIGEAEVRSEITCEKKLIDFAVFHLEKHTLLGGVRDHIQNKYFSQMQQEIKTAFLNSDIPEVIRQIDKYFTMHNYSLRHLFSDEQRKVVNQVLQPTLHEIEAYFRQTYEENFSTINMMNQFRIPLPNSLAKAVEYIINIDIQKVIESDHIDFDRLERLVKEATVCCSLEIDKSTLSFVASQRINSLMEKLSKSTDDVSLMETIESLFRVLNSLKLELDLWKAQNTYFSTGRTSYGKMRENAAKGNDSAIKWLEVFNRVGDYLHVKIS